MASEPIEFQVVVLRVSIHCQGCKKKVKKVLQNISGVYRCEIDARSNKVVATVSTNLDPYMLVAKLRKSGKQAELWPEQPVQQPPPPAAESQSQEPTKNNQPDEPGKPNEPAEKRGADTAEAAAAEPSNPQPSPPEPKQSTGGEAPNPAAQDSKGNASADDAAGDETVPAPAPAQQGLREARGKAKAMPYPEMEERQPVDARVTVEYDHRGVGGAYVNRMPVPPPPAVMSYNQARPSVSTSYYAPGPAPAPMPMPMARQGPSQGYIDEHYTPSYYNNSNNYHRSSPACEPYYYSPPQPAPYSYQYQYQPASSSSEDYYYSAPPQRSAFSPPRDGYGDMFNDENANSCTVM